jgi:hypothetical protein
MRNLLRAMIEPSRHPRRDLRALYVIWAVLAYVFAIADYGDWLAVGFQFVIATKFAFSARAEHQQIKRGSTTTRHSLGTDAELVIEALEAARGYARNANDPVVANQLALLQREIETALARAKVTWRNS